VVERPSVNEHDRIRWARALVFAGSMSVLAYLSYLVIQIRRAAAIRNGSFEDGLWGQRIEQISHATLPQNLVILVPAVAAAVTGALLVRSLVAPVVVHLARLIRVIAGLAFVVVAIAVVGIVAVFFRRYDSVGDTAAVLGRIGGIAMAAATIRLCLEADHET
jgi:hypothetical protein